MATTESSKAKVEKEGAQLKRELKQTVPDLAEKKELEAAYQ